MDASKILIVDDEIIIARELESRLQNLAYDVVGIASSGKEAISMVEENGPDLVLMDIVLKGEMDGIEAAGEIRKKWSVPIIYLTAYADEGTLKRARITEPFAYVIKPFSERELRANIEMALYKQGTEKRLRKVERWFATSMGRIAEGVVVTDRNEVVTYLNAEAEVLTGWQSVEAMGKKIDEVVRLVSRADRVPLEIARQSVDLGPITYQSDEILLVDHGGSDQTVEVTTACIRGEGSVDGFVLVLRNVSERASMQATLRESEAELRRSNDALKEADRRKDEFLAILAHELRNPLAPIRNGLQVIKLAKNNAEAVEQSRAIMERQLAQMIRLIDDLLDVSRISRGKVELKRERVDLAKVVQQAVENSRPVIEEGGHDLVVNVSPDPIYVDADVTRLAQVYSNLLNNAAKYTEPGGRIRLTVERQGQDAVVTVGDNGMGIAAHMLPKVFELFTQVDRSLEKSQGGLGIGLSLVKCLVDMHGGSVEGRSDGHRTGSEFVVRVPVVLSVVGELRDEGGGESIEPGDRCRILVVDDNRDAAESLAMMLTLMGNATQTAFDGLEGLAMAAAFRPELILLDIGMPRLNGYDTARRIREQPWGKNTVLVALTGWGQEEDREKSHDAGFDMHMVKPVDLAVLEKLLANLKAESA